MRKQKKKKHSFDGPHGKAWGFNPPASRPQFRLEQENKNSSGKA
jgi:hypothetical protein